ncbi:hypothetical protein ACP4OV_005963 [Aristida adscensionis]
MAASEVEALKRAYAGIMLNMAQESAARVLAAERRAAALAGRAEAARDDGVAALVRLKTIMEARVFRSLALALGCAMIKEVELQSTAHVQKIKKLEEQLHGAQNTVDSLQVELQRANTELEQTRKTLAEERINTACNKIDSDKSTSAHSKKHLQGGSISLKNKETEDNSCLISVTANQEGAVQNLETVTYRCSPDPPSFMERNKKPKLYHSGCTQRIHALKQRTQGADASLEQNQKQATLNSCSRTRKSDAAKNPHHTKSVLEQILQTKFLGKFKRKRGRRTRPSYKLDSSSEHEQAEYKLSGTSNGNGCLLLLRALEQDLSHPKVSAGNDEEALTNPKYDLSRRGADINLHTVPCELKDVLALNNMHMQKRKRSKTVRVDVDVSDSIGIPESADTLPKLTSEKSMSDSEWSSETTENRSDTPVKNNGLVLQSTTVNLMHQTNANNGQSKSENSSPLLQSTKSEIIDHGNSLVDQVEHRTPDNNTTSWKEVNEDGIYSLASEIVDASSTGFLDEEDKLKVSSGLHMQPSEKPDASTGSSLNKEEHAKASSGASVQAEGVRQIKYTFNRRKRKCASIYSTPQCAVPEKSSDLVSTPKKQEPHPNPETQDHLIEESPQGDSQLVQVAQQLILLAEQKF